MKTLPINGDCTVNDTVRLFPQTITIFNAFGIDSCCGGGLAISIAAERHDIDLLNLLGQLNAAVDTDDVVIPPACSL